MQLGLLLDLFSLSQPLFQLLPLPPYPEDLLLFLEVLLVLLTSVWCTEHLGLIKPS